MNSIQKITLIGSGNVAWHLAHSFVNNKLEINCVISRSIDNARKLGEAVGAKYADKLSDIPLRTDMVLICTTDNVIAELSEQLKQIDAIVAHTAGSVPLSVLCNTKCGVFYPFQTFTKGIQLGNVEFPVCLESDDSQVLAQLKELAVRVSEQVVEINSEQRTKLHLAGVFANNFTNFLYTQAYSLLEINDISTDLLKPLIQQTALKLNTGTPDKLQTGPAARGMIQIIKQHQNLLGDNKELKDLYTLLSGNILDFYNQN